MVEKIEKIPWSPLTQFVEVSGLVRPVSPNTGSDVKVKKPKNAGFMINHYIQSTMD